MEPYHAIGTDEALQCADVPDICSPFRLLLRLMTSAASDDEPSDRVVARNHYTEVINSIRKHDTFAPLLNGEQQDAEEFLRSAC